MAEIAPHLLMVAHVQNYGVSNFSGHDLTVGQYDLSLQKNTGIGDVTFIDNTEAIIKSAEYGEVLSFIQSLPKGLETTGNYNRYRGENQIQLSGGQWQGSFFASLYGSFLR